MSGFKLTAPCRDCPFRSDRPFPLRPERGEEIAHALLSDGSFHCHKTVDYSDDEPSSVGAQECAGSLIILERMGAPHQMMRIAERLGMYDHTKLDMDAPVYDDLDEWVDALYLGDGQ